MTPEWKIGESMRTSIGRRIKVAVGVAFTLVLLVGGISVLLASAISRSVEEGTHRHLEAKAIDRIHLLAHGLVADLHLLVHGGRAFPERPHRHVLEDLNDEIAVYEVEHAPDSGEAHLELVGLDNLKSVLAGLESLSTTIVTALERGQPSTLGELERLNELGREVSRAIDDLHEQDRRKLQWVIGASQQRMRWISTLYLAFTAAGGLFLLLGNRFISRALVMPISELAHAASSIARGDFSTRVSVRRGDEVGQLAESFNLMTDRLEANEAKRIAFEAQLEHIVKDRTRNLEETTAKLRATQAQLLRSERIAVTGQIAADVTHRIRTPLNSLAIHVQLLRRELAGGGAPAAVDAPRDTLAAVEYEVGRINGILEEFIHFARLPAPRFTRIELGSLLNETERLLEPQAVKAGVRIETPEVSIVATVQGDRDQLLEVFLNLGQNALLAMPNGGVISMKLDRAEEWLEVAVADRGPGVPEAEQETIFLPFVTTRADSLGLGLAIVRRIVEGHGGRVFCRNRADGGAVFTVQLPIADMETEP
jgi:signal transduction histidine kinase